MRIRIITGVGILIGTVGLLLLAQTWWYALICAVVCLWISAEYLRALGMLKNWCISLPSLVVAFASPLVTFYPQNFEGCVENFFTLLVGYVLVQVILSVLFYNKADNQSISDVTFGLVYMTMAISALVILTFAHPKHNLIMVLPVIIGALVTDTCAYFVGVFLGKHKLAPDLSPKKTIEGSIGGTVCCVIVFYVYAYIVQQVTALSPRWLIVGIFGLFISGLAQVGDLLMSKIKREHNIKDFGTIFPGHGGMLDRFDSILTCAIVCLFFALLPETFRLFH